MKRGDCLAIVAFPLDNTEYTASAMGAFLATRTRGVYSADDSLAVTANGNMTVTVGPGLAWLKAADYWGLAVCSEAAATLTVPTAGSSAKRMDAVCLRLDKTGNKAELIVKPGTPAAMPVLPPLQRNDSYDEIYLASISLAAGAVAVSAADITDLRLNEDYCGLMRDGVTGIPTAQLSAQADALMAQLRQAIQAASSGEGVSVYTHQKSGTIHKLTGSGHNGRVKLTANVAAGDTVQVNGKTVPAYVGGETFADALAGEALSGRWLSFVWDGAQVNFKGGGGLSATKLALADAAASDVVEGKTFYAGSDKALKTGDILTRNQVGKNGAIGMASNFPYVAITPVTQNTQAHANADGVNRLCLQPPAGWYSGESYVGESYASVASAIGLTAAKLGAGETVLDVNGTSHAMAMFATVGDNRWSGGSPNRLKLAWTLGGTSGFSGFGCWLPAGTYRVCGAIPLADCYVADAGSLTTRLYAAERVYGQSSVWGGSGTFTLNGSQWVSITTGGSNYSECGAVCVYRV